MAGQALQFDGVDDFAWAAATEDFPPAGSGSVTIEGWFKLAAYAPNGSFVVGWGNEGPYLLHVLAFNPDGDIAFSHWAADHSYDVNLPLNVWHHVAAVHDGLLNVDQVYLNGVKVGEAATPVLGVVRTKVTLGTHPNVAGYYFNGLMDEVRIWARTRSAEEIAANMNRRIAGSQPGLVAAWSFEEGGGAISADGSDFGHSLTLSNGTSRTTSDAPVDPRLGVEVLPEGKVRLGWLAAPARGLQLQWTAELGPQALWKPVTDVPQMNGAVAEVFLAPGGIAFFRLAPAGVN